MALWWLMIMTHSFVYIHINHARHWLLYPRRVLCIEADDEGYWCTDKLLQTLGELGNVHGL